MKVITELGFEKPSEIQEKAIPILINGNHDFIGLAQTGTGKTAAFGLPLLERIDTDDKSTQALILAPTRELGQQIAEQIEIFGKYLKKVNALAVYGGAPIVHQIRALKKPQHIIIATPGRLIDLIDRKVVKLNKLKYLVLDEADEMLNMGFKEDIDLILSHAHEDRLTWLFSATMSEDIRRIVKKYMHDPTEVRLNTQNKVNTNIEHQFAVVKRSDKPEALMRFLDIYPDMRGLVFCRTKLDTQELSDFLSRKNYKADALHGDLSQRQRDSVMKRFKSHKLQSLVATDVAARGIDVNDLTHVFHYSLPDDIAYYTHRSGRTARAGKEGVSIAFVSGRERSRVDRIKRQLKIQFKQIRIPSADEIYGMRMHAWCRAVLQQPTKGKIDRELFEEIKMMFFNLSKEELLAKVMVHELDHLDMSSDRDLNDTHSPKRDDWPRKKKKSGHHSKGGHFHKKRSKFKKKKRHY